MLSRIDRPPRWQKHITYDLEWVPDTYQLRLVGVFDGDEYRCYRSIETFLLSECTHKTRGRWFYAHAGGLADMNFLMQYFQKAGGWSVRCAFSGSSAIIVQVSRDKHSWIFVDSLWLLKDKLANIAKWLGTEKGNAVDDMTEAEKKDFFANCSELTLMEYNQQDCEILWLAIDAMQKVLWDLGGQLQRTLASSAMQLFRRRFLSRDIPTHEWINKRADAAYIASRVEVFQEHVEDAYYLDINSSFPHSMTMPCPGEFTGWAATLPDHGIYITDCKITVPESFLPPLPVRIKNRIFFPVGTWRGWFSSVDIELLYEAGGRVERCYEVLTFADFTDLAGYANTIYDMRKAAKTPFERVALKFLLNMLYGKFAEGQDKQAIHLDPVKIDPSWGPECMVGPGLWKYWRRIPIPHRHVPIAVHITAQSRASLWRYMEPSPEVHYCDTDGFSSIVPMPTSKELGGLKLEKIISKCHFLMPKGYYMQGKELQHDGSWKDLGDSGVKLKGFSDMNPTKWGHLLEGRAIRHERMLRIREQVNPSGPTGGLFIPGQRVTLKKLQHNVVQKRFHYPDGSTRPWEYQELARFFNV